MAAGVVPLHNCELTLPENGMRVFKYHKASEAREGYEFKIHTNVGEGAKDRDFYLTAESEGGKCILQGQNEYDFNASHLA